MIHWGRVWRWPALIAILVAFLAPIPANAYSIPEYPKASAELRWMFTGNLYSTRPRTVMWFESLEDDGELDAEKLKHGDSIFKDQSSLFEDTLATSGDPLSARRHAAFGEEPPRTDFYYRPSDRDLAIKIRGPSEATNADEPNEGFVMELKRISSSNLPPNRVPISLARGKVNGTLELWKKWSMKAVEQPPPNFVTTQDPEKDTAELVAIRKTRRMKIYRCPDAPVTILVEVELSSIELFGSLPPKSEATASRHFWSLAFESSNPGRATVPAIPGGFETLKNCLEEVARKRVFTGQFGEPRLGFGRSMGYAEWLVEVLQGR